jgi:hypothetical protein
MFSALKRLFGGQSKPEEVDPIADAIRAGEKEEAMRLVAEAGVWIPYRDPKEQADGSLAVRYFDSESCFPVFSSLQHVIPFLQREGFIDGTQVVSTPAHQVSIEFFSANQHLWETLTLNPGSDSEWKFTPSEFQTILANAKKG